MLSLARTRFASVAQRRSTHFFSHGNIGVAVLRQKDAEHVHHTDPGHDTEVWKKPELVGKITSHATPSTTFFPRQEEVATGKERIEYMALKEGKDPYHGLMDPIQCKVKGTKQRPLEVPSPDSDRVIGCNGAPGEHHQTQWFMVTEDGHKYWEFGHNRCPECGNTFKLKRIQLPYDSIY